MFKAAWRYAAAIAFELAFTFVVGCFYCSFNFLDGLGVRLTSADELKEAVKVDHVCAEYENNYRSADKFIKSDVIVMDCDNE